MDQLGASSVARLVRVRVRARVRARVRVRVRLRVIRVERQHRLLRRWPASAEREDVRSRRWRQHMVCSLLLG